MILGLIYVFNCAETDFATLNYFIVSGLSVEIIRYFYYVCTDYITLQSWV